MIASAVTLLALLGGARDSVPLYTDLGNHHVPVTTRSARAQAYFDQGMRLVYAFNHAEAIRAFREAARLDPKCAMCWWGAALAHGPHVNAGMDSTAGVEAWAALARARAAAGSGVTARERAYIEALSRRYASPPPTDRASLDSAYARAMGDVARRFPADLDAATLYAEALMDLAPWNYWNPDGSPRPDTPVILARLEAVLAKNPDHPGACHYFIHAVEAVEPERAVSCAERLAGLMPGAGHMVHMPGHIYIRVGRWADAIHANEHAVHADATYLEGQKPGPGVYPIGYVPHNYHFLAFAATMAGQSVVALDAARRLRATTPPEVARQVPLSEPYVPYIFLTLTTFGKWDEVLAEPMPPSDLSYSWGLAQYARGVAFSVLGRPEEAAAALDTLVRARASLNPEYVAAGWTTPPVVLAIAEHCLRGEIALRSGKAEEAVGHFQEATRMEDGLLYIEPPDWYYPVRHSLGLALLRAGRAAEAEAVYREDLKRFPRNGWALYGLARSLEAQGKTAEAAAANSEFRAAWSDADVTLTGSRF
jgi:tetratricopeptide (TPR) repeat protein